MDIVKEVVQRVGVREEDARQEIVLYYKPLAACTESPTVVSRAYNKLLPELIK